MYYGLILLALIITLGAQICVTTTYNKYKKIRNSNDLTGKEVAERILRENGLSEIKVEPTSGMLSDHYDPRAKVIRLSTAIYNNPTIAAASVAAHECGHAIQHKNKYLFLMLRNSIVPAVNFSSYAGYFAITIGLLFSAINFIWIGIILELVILLFQVITLPVELNASKRALKEIKRLDILDKKEVKKGRKMLTAAAFTYVASVATTLLEILRLILMVSGRNND